MTISGISSVTDPYQTYQTNGQNIFAQFRQDLQSLGSALRAGNLTDAQKAFADLQQLLSNSSAGNQTQNGQQNPFADDMNTLSKAFSNGSLSDAKDAFAKLQQDMQAVRGNHHRRHHHKVSPNEQGSGQNTLATDFQTLGQALQSGDLSGAQKAFAQLQQDMQAVQGNHHRRRHHKVSANEQGSGQNTLATDFQALGQALQSGDLSGAQKAFAQLQQDFQTYNPSGQLTTESGGSSSINTTT